MRHRFMLAALLAAATLTLAPLAVAGSDDPTPYTVTSDGLTFPRPLVAHDHVNVRLTDGTTASLHLDPNNGHPGAAWVGVTFLPWSALGITSGCVAWVQVAGYDEHHGEGGQPPVCLDDEPTGDPTTTPAPTDDPTATEPTPEETTWTAEPEPTDEPTPPTPSEQPSQPTDPSPTPPATSPEPTEPAATTSAPEPTPSASSTSTTSTPTPSSDPVDVPLDVDHPTDEPELPTTDAPADDDPTTSDAPEPEHLPVTGARTVALSALAVIALVTGTALLVLRRRGGDS